MNMPLVEASKFIYKHWDTRRMLLQLQKQGEFTVSEYDTLISTLKQQRDLVADLVAFPASD
jgi:hypothetical protein